MSPAFNFEFALQANTIAGIPRGQQQNNDNAAPIRTFEDFITPLFLPSIGTPHLTHITALSFISFPQFLQKDMSINLSYCASL
jgi:hypothetical protein